MTKERVSIQLPSDVLLTIFSFVPFSRSYWLNISLVNKTWNVVAYRAFDPRSCDALQRMLYLQNEVSIMKLLDHPLIDVLRTEEPLITFACQRGLLNMVEKLLKDKRTDPSVNNDEAFQQACLNGHLSIVNRLLEHERVNPSSMLNYAIGYASSRGHLEIVKRLLEDERVDPIGACNFAIRTACENGHLHIVELLLENGLVSPVGVGNHSFLMACKNGHSSVVERLLRDERVDPTENDHISLFYACEKGRLEVVKLLLADERVDIEQVYVRALQQAKKGQDKKTIEFLESLREGPEPKEEKPKMKKSILRSVFGRKKI